MSLGELEMGGNELGRNKAGGRNGCRIEDGVGIRVMGVWEWLDLRLRWLDQSLGIQMWWFLCGERIQVGDWMGWNWG